jgi:DNA-directed RNA polymerase
MLHDINLATHVNLLTKKENDKVNDLYQSMVSPINNEVNSLGKTNPLYSKLKNIMLTRDILKRSIMTQVYSVTVNGISKQLIKHFKKEKVIDPKEKNKNGSDKTNTFY